MRNTGTSTIAEQCHRTSFIFDPGEDTGRRGLPRQQLLLQPRAVFLRLAGEYISWEGIEGYEREQQRNPQAHPPTQHRLRKPQQS